MKLQFKLWLAFSLLWLSGLAAISIFLVDLYRNRTFDIERELAFSQAGTIAERISGLIPKFPDRAEGYLDHYSSQFNTRLFMLDERKRSLYDSAGQFAQGAYLSLEILGPGYSPPASIFRNTESFGHVQYTVIDTANPVQPHYLLMVRDANGVFDDIRAFRERITGLLLVLSGIGFLVFYALAKLFTRPISQIIAHLQLITPRNRTFALRLRGKDEFSLLADQIGEMVQQLDVYEKRQRRFISTSSHELKTPLATMQLIVENLPHVYEDEQLRQEYTADLQHQIDKMKQTVLGMIDVYRLSDQQLQKRLLSSEELRRHIEDEHQHLALDRQIQLVYELDGSSLYVDEALFYRGLDNLVGNAMRYSPKGTTVRIAVKAAADARSVKLSVCDQGYGIEEHDLPYVFEPFYRSRRASEWNPEGSGLGLAIVKQMVDLHSGTIQVESRIGAGTCFHLTFGNNRS